MVRLEGNLAAMRETDIVVGVDGSPAAKAALRWALAQARRTGGRVQAVTAWEFPTYYGWDQASPYHDVAVTAGKTLSQSVREALGSDEPDVEVLETVVAGQPALRPARPLPGRRRPRQVLTRRRAQRCPAGD